MVGIWVWQLSIYYLKAPNLPFFFALLSDTGTKLSTFLLCQPKRGQWNDFGKVITAERHFPSGLWSSIIIILLLLFSVGAQEPSWGNKFQLWPQVPPDNEHFCRSCSHVRHSLFEEVWIQVLGRRDVPWGLSSLS